MGSERDALEGFPPLCDWDDESWEEDFEGSEGADMHPAHTSSAAAATVKLGDARMLVLTCSGSSRPPA